MRCFGKILSHRTADGLLGPDTMTQVTGYGPADIQSAYQLAGATSGGRTVAIVDAYHDPKAEADLAAYRSHFGLPACTKANGCFKQVNQNGAAAPLPSTDYGWALEISLDLDMVSATCPDCKILLVEANSATDTDLYQAVDTAAATPGVIAISNSYGGGETAAQTTSSDPHFNHPGVAITASSGDSGYGASYPAASKYVTAVGGTSLTTASNARGWTETAWSGAGSGCSAYDAKPTWQTDTGCARRTIADVSAVADPNTGVAVYDTANSCGTSSLCDRLIQAGHRPGRRRVGAGRRYERVLADHRVGVRAGRQHLAEPAVQPPVRAVRRDVGQQRLVRRDVPVHRNGRATTARPGSARRTAPAPSDLTSSSCPCVETSCRRDARTTRGEQAPVGVIGPRRQRPSRAARA